MSELENWVLRAVERWAASRYHERHGLVTSYDPQKHRAKVMYQPEQFESDWLPIETNHIGPGFGMAVGLTPGDGKQTGDQVIVRHQEGDIESGKVVKVVHSDVDNPPMVNSGEMVIWTKWGQQIRFNQDGSLTLKTGQTPQGARQPGQTDQQFQQQQQQQQQKVPQTSITLDAQGNIKHQADTDITHTAGNNITDTAGQTHQTNANNIGETAQQQNNRTTMSGDITDTSGKAYNNNAKKVVNVQGGGLSVPPTTIS